jgi:hypothetical protein
MQHSALADNVFVAVNVAGKNQEENFRPTRSDDGNWRIKTNQEIN